MKKIILFFSSLSLPIFSKEPVVTAKLLVEYRKEKKGITNCTIPKTVLLCYQRSTMEHLKETLPNFTESDIVSHFITDGKIGILGDWGIGAPALSVKMEELIALGATQFIAVGTAGSLLGSHEIGSHIVCKNALPEDGVAHLYSGNRISFVSCSESLLSLWEQHQMLPKISSWSFVSPFRETISDVHRVHDKGCTTVEMEAATLYAIAKEKKVEALTLLSISDTITESGWQPYVYSGDVKKSLHTLARQALKFCYTLADTP